MFLAKEPAGTSNGAGRIFDGIREERGKHERKSRVSGGRREGKDRGGCCQSRNAEKKAASPRRVLRRQRRERKRKKDRRKRR